MKICLDRLEHVDDNLTFGILLERYPFFNENKYGYIIYLWYGKAAIGLCFSF